MGKGIMLGLVKDVFGWNEDPAVGAPCVAGLILSKLNNVWTKTLKYGFPVLLGNFQRTEIAFFFESLAQTWLSGASKTDHSMN